MNEQTTLANALEMIVILSQQYGRSIRQLSDHFGFSDRTIRRYIRTFRDAGYVVVNRRGKYYIDRDATIMKIGFDLRDLIYISGDEAQVLKAAIQSVNAVTAVKESLSRRMSALYDDERLLWTATSTEDRETVLVLIEAIRRKRQIKILEYTYSTANKGVREITAEPLGFAFNYSRVWAYVHHFRRNMVLRLSGMAGVKATDIPFKHEERHMIGKTDSFRGYGFETRMVEVEMGPRAYGLMTDEFPLTRKLTERIDVDTYLLRAEVCNYREIGRFLLGLPESIFRIDPEELRMYVRDMHGVGFDPRYRSEDATVRSVRTCEWEF